MKGLLGLTIQSVRIDWNFLPKELSEPPAEIDDITLGKYPTVIESFTDLMDRWFSLDNIPSVVRLAFGALLLKPGESAAAVYRDLAQYMPCQFDLENARDFAYRINRKRFSTGRIPGLQLNRLASWSALGIEGQIAPIGTPRATKPVSTFFASRLELDINTDANFDGVIERNRIKELFFELVRLGEEIALEGDIP